MNKLSKSKIFLGIFILIAFMGVSVFGLFEFSHITEIPMPDCPYTQGNFSICENSLSHINNWSQFLNVIPALFFVFLFIILGIVLYFFNRQNFLNQKQYFFRWKYYLYNKKLFRYSNKIIKWLSLFENSPSLSYIRHN